MGDPACWLHRTCQACGRLLEGDEADQAACARCGAALDDDER